MRSVALLLVDDSTLFDDLNTLMKRYGAIGIRSTCGDEALEWVNRPGVDVVIGAGRPTPGLRSAAAGRQIDLISLGESAREAGSGITTEEWERLEILLRGLPSSASRRRGTGDHFDRLLGRSESTLEMIEQLVRMAPSHAPILITGESGTGKGLAAAAIHDRSRNREGPFVAINCGAIPPHLVESQLFGHERGSFTGAERRFAGCFEQAGRGTLFLDEVSELPLEAQVKLLRVLESGEVLRVGGERPVPLHCRIVAATNRCPEQAVRAGRLRKDLFYRLSVLRLVLPPLRERQDDIPYLARHFTGVLADQEGSRRHLAPGAVDRLLGHTWPGNVRELRNTLHAAVVLSRGPVIREEDLPIDTVSTPFHQEHLQLPLGIAVEEAERRLILRTLAHLGGNKARAARVLGISLKTLYNRLHAYGEILPRGETTQGTA